MMTTAGSRLMATALGLGLIGTPSLVFTHVGHLGELAGHSHWVGAAALAGAALVAGIAALKGHKKKDGENDPVAEPDGEVEVAQ